MQRDDDKRDQRQKPERITVAQDGYPESWSYGAVGKVYRRTWFGRPGQPIPKLKDKER